MEGTDSRLNRRMPITLGPRFPAPVVRRGIPLRPADVTVVDGHC